MDTYTLISNIVDSMAWPITTVIIVVLLRKDIGDVLSKIKSIKHNNTEIDLGREISKTKKLVKAQENINNLNQEKNITETNELAMLSPRGAIIESWLNIEKALDGYAKRYKLQTSGRKPFTLKDISWHNHDYRDLGKGTLEILHKLRQIRNDAVHLQDSNIDSEDAKDYSLLAKRIIDKIETA